MWKWHFCHLTFTNKYRLFFNEKLLHNTYRSVNFLRKLHIPLFNTRNKRWSTNTAIFKLNNFKKKKIWNKFGRLLNVKHSYRLRIIYYNVPIFVVISFRENLFLIINMYILCGIYYCYRESKKKKWKYSPFYILDFGTNMGFNSYRFGKASQWLYMVKKKTFKIQTHN